MKEETKQGLKEFGAGLWTFFIEHPTIRGLLIGFVLGLLVGWL